MELIIFIGTLSFIVAVEIIVGALFILKKKNNKIEEYEKEESKRNKLLCRFVLDGTGKRIGESVAIDDDIMIIKTGSKYLGVPMKHIEEEEKTLLVKGLVDHSRAEEMGERWRQNSHKEITPPAEGEQDDRF